MTMRDLAKLANVSASTVSKAFNDAADVSPETKELIFALAKKHGCFHKFYKEKYEKPIFAIICPEIKSPYYAGYVEKLQDIIIQNGGIALISTDNFDTDVQAELIDYYASYLKVNGIFVFQMQAPLKKEHLTTAVVGIFSSKDVEVDSVLLDFNTPLKQAIEYLYKIGHKHIAFIGENFTRYKAEKFEKICRTLPIKQTVILAEGRFDQTGKNGAREILGLKDKPTAIICGYDNIAMGFIKEVKNRGYSVPNDFSVMGMDNIIISSYLETTLSTIDTRPDEVCMIAWDLLDKKRKNPYYKLNQKITLSGRFVIRETIKEII